MHQSILPILGGILQPEGYDPGDALVMEVYSRDRGESTFGGPGRGLTRSQHIFFKGLVGQSFFSRVGTSLFLHLGQLWYIICKARMTDVQVMTPSNTHTHYDHIHSYKVM